MKGDTVGKISQEERREGYCKVAGQLCSILLHV